MKEYLRQLFKTLDQENIEYCLIRDADQLDSLPSGAELDILVRPGQFVQLRGSLARLNFVSLPGWGHSPHNFFVGYDHRSGDWLKLDVITEITCGRPTHTLRTGLAGSCLDNRRRFGQVFIPSPEDELVALLLHCVLDKGYFTDIRRQRIQILRQQVANERYISALLVSFWLPSMTWQRLATQIDTGNWTGLLKDRKSVESRLARRDRLGTIERQISSRVLRRLNHWITSRRPKSIMVALLAPDGAGKSSLALNIEKEFYFSVRRIYMGLYQKQGEKGSSAHKPYGGFLRRLLRQWWNYLLARYHFSRRRLIIFDRYSYDARLHSAQTTTWQKRLRRWLLANSCPPPDLIFLLDAPGEVLFARKGEHSSEFLEKQRQSYLQLKHDIPQMVVLDATLGPEQVLRHAMAVIWQGYLSRQAGLNSNQFLLAAKIASMRTSRQVQENAQ